MATGAEVGSVVETSEGLVGTGAGADLLGSWRLRGGTDKAFTQTHVSWNNGYLKTSKEEGPYSPGIPGNTP